MKNAIKLLGILAFALVFGMTVFGCKDKSDDNGNGNNNGDSPGTFTLTNIPAEYNGKYVIIEAGNETLDDVAFGFESFNKTTQVYTLSRISNGSVSVPMWDVDDDPDYRYRYSGNHTIDVSIAIQNLATEAVSSYHDTIVVIYFESVKFSNGSATRSWNNGKFYEYDNDPKGGNINTDTWTDHLVQGMWVSDDYTLFINNAQMMVKYAEVVTTPYRTEWYYITPDNGAAIRYGDSFLGEIILFDYKTNDEIATIQIVCKPGETLTISNTEWYVEEYSYVNAFPIEGKYEYVPTVYP
jgi:hypothetical protein